MRFLFFISICCAGTVLFSCKSRHLIKTKINPDVDSNTIGLIVQCGEQEDTSAIIRTTREALNDCHVPVLEDFFSKDIYLKENFERLFGMDSSFIAAQPTLNNLKQLLAVKVVYVDKPVESAGKRSGGIVFLARWISLSPLLEQHDFYYVEKVNITDGATNWPLLISYMVGQVHAKLCYDIHQYILKNK